MADKATSQEEDTEIAERFVEIIGETLKPNQVFDNETLSEWALENGFVKEVETTE